MAVDLTFIKSCCKGCDKGVVVCVAKDIQLPFYIRVRSEEAISIILFLNVLANKEGVRLPGSGFGHGAKVPFHEVLANGDGLTKNTVAGLIGSGRKDSVKIIIRFPNQLK